MLHCHHSPPLSFSVSSSQNSSKGSVHFQISEDSYCNNIFSRIVFTLVNIWSLDFFRYAIPPFCVSREVSDLHVVLLQYVSVFYPLLLVVITYIGIELHARNFYPVVILWKPCHRVFALLRRSIDPRSSIIAAFATFISLALSKVIWISTLVIYSSLYSENETSNYLVSLINPAIKVEYNNSKNYTEYFCMLLSSIPLI